MGLLVKLSKAVLSETKSGHILRREVSAFIFIYMKRSTYLRTANHFTNLLGICYNDTKLELSQKILEVGAHIGQPPVHMKYTYFTTQKTH